MKASVSPRIKRRSLCPRMTQRQPASSSISTATSPVNAPGFSGDAFCAPSSTPLPATADATAARYGKGGQTATCTVGSGAGTARATAPASSTAERDSVFIFQLPATKNRLIASVSLVRVRGKKSASRPLRNGLLSVRCRNGLVEDAGQLPHLSHDGGVLLGKERLRAVAQRLFRATMDFNVHAVGPRRDGCQRHGRDQVRSSRGMAGIDDDR